MIFGEEAAPLERARVVVLPVPYDLSLSWLPGARKGPEAILRASPELEFFDLELGVDPSKAGIYTAPSVPIVAGDAALSHQKIEEAAREYVEKGKFLVALGGDHSITLPLVRAHREVLGDFAVLHVDAHDDLYDAWQGSRLSHASVMRRVAELGVPIVQVAQRAYAEESLRFAKEAGIPVFPAHRIHQEGMPTEAILKALPDRVYLSFDFDALDPGEMPAVGTPLPGGLGFRQAVDLLAAVAREKTIVGADFVELSPIPGLFYPEMTAASLVYRLIGLKAKAAGWV